jgi:hypothetical protein
MGMFCIGFFMGILVFGIYMLGVLVLWRGV